MTDLLSISQFSAATRLAPSALRYYDRIGLLRPRKVDVSGYRWYAIDQLSVARLIAALRAVDCPIAEIRLLLEADPDMRHDLLDRHRDRVAKALGAALQAIDELHRLVGELESPMNRIHVISKSHTAEQLQSDVLVGEGAAVVADPDKADLIILETAFADPAEDARAVRDLRSRGAAPAVLIVSTSSRREHVEAARDAGASGYLIAPYVNEDLQLALTTAVSRR